MATGQSERPAEDGPPPVATGLRAAGLHHLLELERLRGVRRINVLRFWGVSAFFALFLLLGGVLGLPAWQGNLRVFCIYWALAAAVFWASRRARPTGRRPSDLTALAIAFVDTPLVFLLQWSTFPTSPSASGIAGFTVGVYVLFVILATLSLERRYILITAASGAVFEVTLQHLADVSVGAMVSTAILIGLATLACLHFRDRVVRLVQRVEAAAQLDAARRSTEERLRETTGLLGIAHTLDGVTEVPEALRRICRELTKLTGAETAAAYLVDRERAELRPTAAYHVPKPLLHAFGRTALPLQDVAFAAELEQGRLLWSHRVSERPELALWPPDRFPLQSALVVPLTVDDKLSGLFYLVWWTAEHRFDPAGLALAEAVGRQVGGFIETARLYQELDRSRRRSVQIERLRALGEMAAGVAHDFNNLLAIILGRAELLLHAQPAAAPAAERRPIELIVQAARDGARTVRRIQEFTRRTPRGPLRPVSLGGVVRDVIEMTRPRWDDEAQANGIRYEVAAEDDETPPVLADAPELRDALTNLVPERARRDAVGRPAHRAHDRGGPARPLRGDRHRARDAGPRARARVRAVLLDKARDGQRARAQHRLRDRHAPRRGDRGGQCARRGLDVRALAAHRGRRAGGGGGRARGDAAPARAAGARGRGRGRGARRPHRPPHHRGAPAAGVPERGDGTPRAGRRAIRRRAHRPRDARHGRVGHRGRGEGAAAGHAGRPRHRLGRHRGPDGGRRARHRLRPRQAGRARTPARRPRRARRRDGAATVVAARDIVYSRRRGRTAHAKDSQWPKRSKASGSSI